MLMASKKRFYFLSPFRYHKGCPHLQKGKKLLLKAQLYLEEKFWYSMHRSSICDA
jgi:hypothetical protein